MNHQEARLRHVLHTEYGISQALLRDSAPVPVLLRHARDHDEFADSHELDFWLGDWFDTRIWHHMPRVSPSQALGCAAYFARLGFDAPYNTELAAAYVDFRAEDRHRRHVAHDWVRSAVHDFFGSVWDESPSLANIRYVVQ